MPTDADALIIGAGPAGLAAALAFGEGALLLERNPEAGRKLLLSGSGQCNFTNSRDRDGFLSACGNYAHFLKPAFYAFGNQAFISLLESSGCPVLVRPDGKAFPRSLKAADVRDAMLREALRHGARIRYRAKVADIGHDTRFRVTLDSGETLSSPRLIITGGGASWPQTGSDGSTAELAAKLGHSIRAPRPALASVTARAFGLFAGCAGITQKGVSAVFYTESGRSQAMGDLLFTHTGLSGPLILDNSWQLGPGDRVSLCLVPRSGDRLPEILSLGRKQSLLQALRRFSLPENLLRTILASAGIDPAQICAEVKKETRNMLSGLLSGLEFTVQSVESLSTAMGTCGGVLTSGVKAKSMESRLIPGLYFAGEVLDYNLPTGGYNIQTAVSTGWLAGKSARSREP
jgi:predicted Rossmann fold flavoprotein